MPRSIQERLNPGATLDDFLIVEETHRIKHPTTKGAIYIAEAVISRLESNAGRRCGSYDTLYDQFLSEEIHEFADTLNSDDRDKFIDIATSSHPHLKEYDTDKTKDILNQIREDQM